jgi:hypothetical protein
VIGDHTTAPSVYVVPLTHFVALAAAVAAAAAATASAASAAADTASAFTSTARAFASVAKSGNAPKNASARVAKFVGSSRLGGVGSGVMAMSFSF